MLAEVLVDPDHPLRAKVNEGLARLAHDLQHDPEMQAKVARWKRELLDNPAVGNWWEGVWERLRASLIASARGGGGPLMAQLAEATAELGRALEADPHLQHQNQPLRPPHSRRRGATLR